MKPVISNGHTYPIEHLAPMEFGCPCTQIGRDLRIGVDFRNHCYSEDFDGARHTRGDIILYDSPDRPRVFCPIRYNLSFRLPDIVRNLSNSKVHQTWEKRNYVYSMPLEIEGEVYEVYFMLQRAESDPVLDLRLTVESAYSPPRRSPLPKRPNSIRFKVLAYKTLRREKINFAAR